MRHTTIAEYLKTNNRKLFSVYSLVDNFNYQKKRREREKSIKNNILRRDIQSLGYDKTKMYDEHCIYAYSPITSPQTLNNFYPIINTVFSNEFDCIDYCFNNSFNVIGVYIITKDCIFRKNLSDDTLRGNILKIKATCQLELKEIIDLSS